MLEMNTLVLGMSVSKLWVELQPHTHTVSYQQLSDRNYVEMIVKSHLLTLKWLW